MKKYGTLLLFLLLGVFVLLFCLRFFYDVNSIDDSDGNITETDVDSEKNKVINDKLDTITFNINGSDRVKKFLVNNVKITATRNNYSVFVNHNNGKDTVTYEFKYDDGSFTIIIDSKDDNFSRFKDVFLIFVEARDKLLGNNADLSSMVNDFFAKEGSYTSINVEKIDDNNRYTIDLDYLLEKE